MLVLPELADVNVEETTDISAKITFDAGPQGGFIDFVKIELFEDGVIKPPAKFSRVSNNVITYNGMM